jgi:hypothetical protein
MARFRGMALFDSGPTRVMLTAVEEEVQVSRFPGIDGEHHLVMGRPGHDVIQEGTLTAASGSELLNRMGAICDQVGQRGDLVDDLGWTYADCVLLRFELAGPRRLDAGGRHCADYRLRYRQAMDEVV